MIHDDLLRIYADSKTEAMEKAKEFLHLYNKQKIRIRSIEGTNNFFEVFVSYMDDYEEGSIYQTSDIDPELLTTFKRSERDDFDEYIDELAGDVCIDFITKRLVKHYVNTQKK